MRRRRGIGNNGGENAHSLCEEYVPDDVKAGIDFYRRVHPGATAQQAAAFVQKGIDSGRQPLSSNLKGASDFLHGAGIPSGFWENVGAIGNAQRIASRGQQPTAFDHL
jgi:hypothetical protein